MLRCSYPEVDWTDETIKEDYVYTKYNLGSIVWAKMASYPRFKSIYCVKNYKNYIC